MKATKRIAVILIVIAAVIAGIVYLNRDREERVEPGTIVPVQESQAVETEKEPEQSHEPEIVEPIIKASPTNIEERVVVMQEYAPDAPVILPEGDPIPDFDIQGLINEALQAFRKNVSTEEKMVLMSKIEMINDPVVLPVILEALKDPDEEIRQSAIEAMRMIDDPAVVPAVEQALADEDMQIREDAVDSLLMIHDEAINQALLTALKDPEEGVRETALDVMITQSEPHLLPLLDTMLDFDDTGMRVEAIGILEDIPAPGGIELLINKGLLNDADDVRAAAKEALEDLSGRSFSSPEAWATWWDSVKKSCPAGGDVIEWDTWWQEYK